MAKKRKNSLSIAIVALNLVIVGIIILLIVLIYFHMKEDSGSDRTDRPSVTVSETDTSSPSESESLTPPNTSETSGTSSDTSASESASVSSEDSAAETEETISTDDLILPQYDRTFFENDLFIGDSISTGLHLYGYLDAENVFAEVGLNPESAVNHKVGDVTCVEKAAAMQPKRIYIMLGTNGLAYMDAEYMANKMTELVSELEMACYTAEICVISLPPVTKEHDSEGKETMEKINDYNSRLKSICDQGGYTYVDICSKLTDGEGYFSSKYAENDGLHFQGSAYALLLGTIQKQIG